MSGDETSYAFLSSIFIITWFACALIWFPLSWGFWIPGVLGGIGGALLMGVILNSEEDDSPFYGFISGGLFTGVGVITIFFWIWTPVLSSFLSAVGAALLVDSMQ